MFYLMTDSTHFMREIMEYIHTERERERERERSREK